METFSEGKRRFLPFLLTAAVVAADQFTKALVVARIPLYGISWTLGGDFFRIIHVRNRAIAFSIGHGLPDGARTALFLALPLVILLFLAVYLVKGRDVSQGQRWLLAGILGGGLGNMIDRLFRDGGVVDFLDVKFYGLLGFDRWPTFNVADSVIVVTGILLFVSLLAGEIRGRQNE